MKYGIIVFPGSNCDHDAKFATSISGKAESVYIWHKESTISDDVDCIILPGGFSYGDYLRCGAIARFSPVMKEVRKFADKGKFVIGICNGFQILMETQMLPGTLLRNNSLNFICKDVFLNVRNNSTAFTSQLKKGDVLRIPIAHGEGNYFASEDTIKELEDNEQIVFQYSSRDGNIDIQYNPNGSVNNIAGIVNRQGNILGMMPHPERYSDETLGFNDGLKIFESLRRAVLQN